MTTTAKLRQIKCEIKKITERTKQKLEQTKQNAEMDEESRKAQAEDYGRVSLGRNRPDRQRRKARHVVPETRPNTGMHSEVILELKRVLRAQAAFVKRIE